MPQGLTSKVSFTSWVLGGPLVTVTKIDTPASADTVTKATKITKAAKPSKVAKGACRVVITEVDSDGNEIDKHIVPLTTHKKKTVTISSVKSDSETDIAKSKETPPQTEVNHEGPYCSFCGHRREHCLCKDADHTTPAFDEPKIETATPKVPETETEDNHEAEWSKVQDEIIVAMKGENRPWKEIAAVVGSTKKSVQARFKTLQAAKESGEPVKNTTLAKGLGISDADIPDFDFDKFLIDEDSGADAGNSGNDAPFSNLTGYDGYAGNKKKTKKYDEKTKSWVDTPNISSDWYKISPPGLSPAGISPAESFEMPPIPKQPPRYGEPFVDSDSPPPILSSTFASRVNRAPRLRPDLIWSSDDCELLQDLEARYKEHKWLHIQADFFNWSGRMVDASIIERKFKEDGYC